MQVTLSKRKELPSSSSPSNNKSLVNYSPLNIESDEKKTSSEWKSFACILCIVAVFMVLLAASIGLYASRHQKNKHPNQYISRLNDDAAGQTEMYGGKIDEQSQNTTTQSKPSVKDSEYILDEMESENIVNATPSIYDYQDDDM